MDGEDPARLQVLEIEIKRFSGHQVHGNGVAAEGIDDQNVEGIASGFFEFLLEREPRVSLNDLDRSHAVRDEGEVASIAGDLDDRGINLVETEAVGLATIRRQGAHSQTHNADVERSSHRALHQRDANTGCQAEIRCRPSSKVVGQELNPMQGGSVDQASAHRVGVVRHDFIDTKDPEEAPFLVKQARAHLEGLGRDVPDQGNGGGRSC